MKHNPLKLIDPVTGQSVRVDRVDNWVKMSNYAFCVAASSKTFSSAYLYRLYFKGSEQRKILYQRLKMEGLKSFAPDIQTHLMRNQKHLASPPAIALLRGRYRGRYFNILIKLEDFKTAFRWGDESISIEAAPLDNLQHIVAVHELRKIGKYPFPIKNKTLNKRGKSMPIKKKGSPEEIKVVTEEEAKEHLKKKDKKKKK